MVALAADALGAMPVDQLPAALKRVASFAPNRRARLAGTQIAGVLETDEGFREHLAVQVRAHDHRAGPGAGRRDDARRGRSRGAGGGGVPAAARRLGRRRRTGRGRGRRREARRAGPARPAGRPSGCAGSSTTRTAELKALRERTREQVSALKTENSDLRHKLGDARRRVKAAEDQARAAERNADEAVRAAGTTAASSEAEVRRLRGRVAELEEEVAAARREGKAEKGEGTLRARLLLDTLLETAQGLRRELALPPVEGAPADAVEADVAEQGARTPSSHGSLAKDDPALLDQLLALPRVHLVVDGYNVTKNAWPESSLEIQRDRLLGQLGPLAARTQAEVTVVFDAADVEKRPPVKKPRGVRVLYSPFGVIADDVIRSLVAAEPTGRPVVVVTSDQAVVRDVQRGGARVVDAAALTRLLARG